MRRKGSQLTLGGRPFRFAGATNYYMLSRAVDKTTRPQVPGAACCIYPNPSPVQTLSLTTPLTLLLPLCPLLVPPELALW